MLLAECARAGAVLRLETKIAAIEKTETGFRVTTGEGALSCAKLVVATGGLSIPKIGATGLAYDIARQFGLGVVAPRPALVPFTFDAGLKAELDGLAGVAVDATVACGKARFAEALLFTHKGLSGPAILQISSYWRPGEEIEVDLAPHTDVSPP